MDVFTAIETRRAVKVFDPAHRLSEPDVERLFRLAMLSPTAFNMQNWRFVRVREAALRQRMRQAFRGKAQVTDASLLVLLCADLRAWERQPERYWAHVGAEQRGGTARAMEGFYRDHEGLWRDEAMRSCGLAAQTMMLAARAMELDSCPMIGFDFEAVQRLIRLPQDHCLVMALAIGRALEPAPPRGGRLALEEVLITDRFPS